MRSGRVRTYDLGGGRGLRAYGRPVVVSAYHGNEVTVQTSSSAEEPHCWLRIKDDATEASASAHLNLRLAKEVVRRLQTWIEDYSPAGEPTSD